MPNQNTAPNQPLLFPNVLSAFVNWLAGGQLTARTVDNYVSDVRRFFLWLETEAHLQSVSEIDDSIIQAYVELLSEAETPENTINRKLSSLRVLRRFVETGLRQSVKWSIPTNPAAMDIAELAKKKVLGRFSLALQHIGVKELTRKNYILDTQLFLNAYANKPLTDLAQRELIDAYLLSLREQGAATNTLNRKLTSLRHFFAWAADEKYIPANPLQTRLERLARTVRERFVPLAFFEPARRQAALTEAYPGEPAPGAPYTPVRAGLLGWYDRYSQSPISSYLHLSVLVIFCIMLGLFGYAQFFGIVGRPLAFPSEPTAPLRTLNFQGRLTDTAGTPITTPINFTFRLYDDDTAGNELWDSSDGGVCSIDPDQDGIFSTILGDLTLGCGTTIDDSVFSENASVWLEVQVSTQTLAPRQPINAVPYALNSETLQGFPVTLTGGINTIPLINALGQIIIGANNPQLIASSGAFLIQGESITLQTEAGTGGDINLNPDTGGIVNVYSTASLSGQLTFTGPTDPKINVLNGENFGISTSVGGDAGLTERFTVLNNGNVGVGTTNPTQKFTVDANGAQIRLRRADATRYRSDFQISSSGLNINAFDDTGGVYLPIRVDASTLSVYSAGSTLGLYQGSSGQVSIGDATPASLFNVGTTSQFQVDSSGNIVAIGGAAHSIANASNDLVLTAVDDLMFNDVRTGDIPLTVADTALNANLTQGIVDAINDIYDLSGTNDAFWVQNLGALYPANPSVDVLIGSTATTTAKFAFKNVLTGTPTASISGSANVATLIDGNGNIVTTNRTNLVLGNSAWYNSTGSILLHPGGTGTVGVGTVSPLAQAKVTVKGSSFSVLTSGIDNAGFGVLSSHLPTENYTLDTTYVGGDYTSIGLAGIAQRTTPGGNSAIGVLGIGNGGYQNAIGGRFAAQAYDAIPAYGVRSAAVSFTGANGYGIYIDAGSGAGTNWGLYQAGASDKSYFAGSVGLGDTTPATNFVVGSDAGISIANAAGNAYFQGNIEVDGTTTFNNIAYTWPSTQSTNFILQTNGTGGLSWVDPSVAAGATNYWSLALGALYPTNTSVDLLVGGTTTASAKFAFKNVNSGVPTASISGTTTDVATFIDGNGNISTTNRANLVLGNSATYDSTGDILLNPSGTRSVGIGTTAPEARLHVSGARSKLNNILVGEISASFDLIQGLSSSGLRLITNGPALTLENSSGEIVRVTGTNVGIGDTTPASMFTVGNTDLFQINSSGNIVAVGGAAHSIANASNDLVLTAVDDLIFNDVRTGDIPLTIADTALNANLTQGIIDAINDLYSTSATTDTFWAQAAGALYPVNPSVDVLIGSTATTTAKFAFKNVLTGVPTASISGTTTDVATFVDGNGNISTTNRANLVLGNSATYDSTGNILLNPNGTGFVGIGTTNPEQELEVNGDIILSGVGRAIQTSAGNSLYLDPATGIVNLYDSVSSYQLSGYNAGTEAFRIAASGDSFLNGGNVGIGDNSPASLFTVGNTDLFQINSSGNIVAVGGAAHSIANASNDLVLTAVDDLIFNDVRTGDIPLTIADTALNASLTQGIVDAINDLYDISSTGGDSFWAEAAGALYPINSSLDVLIGSSATTTAKFAFKNVSAGVPTASISGSLTDVATFIDGNGNISTTNKNNLVLGNSSTYNSTGNILLNPNDVGRVGIGVTDPTKTLDIDGSINLSGDIFFTEGQGLYYGSNEAFTLSSNVIYIDPGLSTGFVQINGHFRPASTNAQDLGTSANKFRNLYLSGQALFGNLASNPTTLGDGSVYYNTTDDHLYLDSAGTFIPLSQGISPWYRNDTTKTIYPTNVTYDVLIGGTTTDSAKFSVNATAGTFSLSATGTNKHTFSNQTRIVNSVTFQNLHVASNGYAVEFDPDIQINGGDIIDLNAQTRITLVPSSVPTAGVLISGVLDVTDYINGRRGATLSAARVGDKVLTVNGSSDGAQTADFFQVNSNSSVTTGDILRLTSDGYLGLGNVNPLTRLDVEGSASLSGALTFRGTTDPKINLLNGEDFGIRTSVGGDAGLTERLTVLNNGAIGIGDSTPTSQLYVNAAYGGNSAVTIDQNYSGEIFTASASGATRFTIANDGDTTIGTASAEIDLSIYGDLIQKANTDLTAISSITDTYVYDTTKDSDGGDWTDNAIARQSSWYNETKDDGWNDQCVISADDRCGKSAFPKKAVIVATESNVYIFDAQDNNLWMRFSQTAGYTLDADFLNDPSSVFMLNGTLYVGTYNTGSTGLYAIDFRQDKTFRYNTNDRRDRGTNGISARNTSGTYANPDTGYALNSSVISDVHAAIVNGRTFIAVATDSELSVIRPGENQVLDYSDTSGDDYYNVWLTRDGNLYGTNATLDQLERWNQVVFDEASEIGGTPDQVFDETTGSEALLWNATPTIQQVQAFFVDENAAPYPGSNVVYVGHADGLTAIADSYPVSYDSAKYYNISYITEEMYRLPAGVWPFIESSGTLVDVATTSIQYLEDEGPPTYGVSGVRGTGLTFDGSTDYLCSDANNDGTCDTDTDFNFGTGPFYVSVWIKTTVDPGVGTFDAIVDRTIGSGGAANDGFRVDLVPGGLIRFGIDDDTTSFPEDSATSTGAYNDGQWHHVVAAKYGVSSPLVIRLFIDGEQVASTTVTATGSISDAGSTVMAVGAQCALVANCASAQNHFGGSIDELTIGSKAITADAVRRMYMSGKQALQFRTIAVTDATATTTTSISDGAETWTPNEFVGAFVEITGGTGSGQTRRIASNSATLLTVSPAWATTPDTTSDFQINPNELYGSEDGVLSVAVSDGAPGKQRTLYVGASDGGANGGITALRLDGDYVTDLYHGDAGKTDDTGAVWNSSASNDTAYAMSAHSDVLAIGTRGIYWQEYGGRSLTEKVDSLTNTTNNLQTAMAGVLSDSHRQDNGTDRTLGYQVIRKGWGYTTHAAAASAAKTVTFGITYDEIPLVFISISGLDTSTPVSLDDCHNATASVGNTIAAHRITTTSFLAQDFERDNTAITTNICFSWLAIGTYSAGAAVSPFAGVAPWANGADLAEWYPTNDATLTAGEVVSVDTNGQIKVARSGKAYDTASVGIIATQPAIVMGPESGLTPGYKDNAQSPSGKSVAVALSGRVPVKVSLEGGKIKAGDPLTTASTPGYAMKATKAGPTIGKAMEDFDGTTTIVSLVSNDATASGQMAAPEGTGAELAQTDPEFAELNKGHGVIMAFVNTSWYDPDAGLSNTDQLRLRLNEAKTWVVENAAAAVTRVGAFSDVVAANLQAGLVTAQDIVANRVQIKSDLLTPVLLTDTIRPTASGSGDLVIDLRRPDTASGSASGSGDNFGTLLVRGHASVSGTLFADNLSAYSARLIQLESAQADVLLLTANDASVSGTLRAGRLEGEIQADQITNLEERVSNLIARRRAQEIPASESATLALDPRIQTLIDQMNGQSAATSSDRWGTVANNNGDITADRLAQIDSDIKINGLVAANSLALRDSLALGSTLLSAGNLTFTTTGACDPANPFCDTFAIQPSGLGRVSILASTLVIAPDGIQINTDLNANGNVRVGQSLFADLIQPNAGQNIEVKLASADIPDKLGELIIRGQNDEEVAAFSASGSARLRKLIIAAENASGASESATISILTNSTAGTAVLPANANSFVIRNSQVREGSLIYLTPTSSTGNRVLFVQAKTAENPATPESEGQFAVTLDSPADQDVHFNWWIIN